MTLEAIALHLLDNLDAKLYSVAQIMKEDAGGESAWTSYNQALGRKFFKGSGKGSGFRVQGSGDSSN
jgi:3'-5' exoribonuclease